jgi:hypothetical protein
MPRSGKEARPGGCPDSILNERVTLSFRYLDFDGPFGWRVATADRYTAALARVKELERLTWREVLIDQKKQNHAISVSELAKDAQDRLRELRLDDYDELLSLRVQKPFRIWAIRVEKTLCLFWYDPSHKVYPTNDADN